MGIINGLLKEEMPREKLISLGPNNLTKVELLAIILRTGTKNKNVLELSREIINKFDTNIISRKSYNELLQFNGISKVKACQIVSVFELSRRLYQINNKISLKFQSSKDVFQYVRDEFIDLKIEKIFALLVDSQTQLIKKIEIAKGSVNFSYIEPRDILKEAFNYDASGFFLIHNHPSGNTNPSQSDIKTTKQIFQMCKNLNLNFLDHIIISNENYYSMFDNDLIS